MTGNSKHDKYLDCLDDYLQEEYTKTLKNVDCVKRGRNVTEIDLLCFVDDNTVDIYEVKSNYSKKQHYKAIKQLNKQRNYVQKHWKLTPRNTYMYIGSEDKLYEVYQ